MQGSFAVVLTFTLATALGGWAYFRRVRINRPPIGVINLRDTLILITALVLMPYLYLALPLGAVTVLLGVVVLTLLHMTLEPILPQTTLLWGVCLALLTTDIVLAVVQGVTNASFLLTNNLILTIMIVGAANLWAQSGMKARDVAVLATALTVYDVIATWHLTVMTDVIERLSQLPLVPVVAWGLSDPQTSLRLGIGDLILLTVGPLVFRKAYGRKAGLFALGSGLVVVAAILALLTTAVVPVSIPVMAALGPVLVGQYWYWRRVHGAERTTTEYLLCEPRATK